MEAFLGHDTTKYTPPAASVSATPVAKDAVAAPAPAAYAAPAANSNAPAAPATAVAPQAANQNALSLEQIGQMAAQELSMLSARVNEQQFMQIAQAMNTHPVSQQMQQEMVVWVLAMNTALKLTIAFPQVPADQIVGNVMQVFDEFKNGKKGPNGESLPDAAPRDLAAAASQFMGIAAAYVANYGPPQLPSTQGQTRAAVAAPTPQGLQQAPQAGSITLNAPANSNVSLAGHQHQGTVHTPHAAIAL